jgi:hypothetical protein
MNFDQEKACKMLRSFSSAKAVEWLIENYNFEDGNAGEAYLIMPHRSWSKPDQIKLADYYLSNLPHRSDRGYKAFLKFMGLHNFLKVIERHLPADPGQRTLIKYYLQPILESHSEKIKYEALVSEFLNSIGNPVSQK